MDDLIEQRAAQYAQTLKLAGAICRGPNTYQTRTSARRPHLIAVKGEHMKGWEWMTVRDALERFKDQWPQAEAPIPEPPPLELPDRPAPPLPPQPPAGRPAPHAGRRNG